MTKLDELQKKSADLAARIEANKAVGNLASLEEEAKANQQAIIKVEARNKVDQVAAEHEVGQMQAQGEKMVDDIFTDLLALYKKIMAYWAIMTLQQALIDKWQMRPGLKSLNDAGMVSVIFATVREIKKRASVSNFLVSDKRLTVWADELKKIIPT
jgi:hypothetical protein